ncbi:MAG: SemiSWEET family transporter [Candidatus Nitrosoabyssus spongiisocia]|nr:MAG: SemiSWEET family transporter [Nitrosopumilaceae archaeon AB1(1)]
MSIDPLLLSLIAIFGGIFILLGWVKQIIKGYQTKKLDDVSKYLLLLILTGVILWTIYGVYKDDLFIIGTNVVAIAFMIIILVMKFSFKNQS